LFRLKRTAVTKVIYAVNLCGYAWKLQECVESEVLQIRVTYFNTG